MFKSFFASKKWAVWAYGGGFLLVASIFVQVELSVAINDWQGGFYNMLQSVKDYNVDDFGNKVIQFLYLALPYIFIMTASSYVGRLYALKWREALTFDYLDKWRNSTEHIEGASQRIQEDCYRFSKIVEGIGLQVLRAIMTLIAFVPILWHLSTGVVLPLFGDIAGSLVWIALIISLGGILVAWIVGIKLPGLEYNNQKVEAAFRKELVYGEDDKINYADHRTISELFISLRFNYNKLFFHYGYFDLYINFYNQTALIAPLLIMGPGLLGGLFTLGVMMQAIDAFGNVNSSFSLLTYQWTTITELRSIYKRLKEFEIHIGYK